MKEKQAKRKLPLCVMDPKTLERRTMALMLEQVLRSSVFQNPLTSLA